MQWRNTKSCLCLGLDFQLGETVINSIKCSMHVEIRVLKHKWAGRGGSMSVGSESSVVPFYMGCRDILSDIWAKAWRIEGADLTDIWGECIPDIENSKFKCPEAGEYLVCSGSDRVVRTDQMRVMWARRCGQEVAGLLSRTETLEGWAEEWNELTYVLKWLKTTT